MKAVFNSSTGMDLLPETPDDASLLDRIADRLILTRVYILSKKVTPGLKYNDRLEDRLRLKRTTICEMKAAGLLQFIPAKGKLMMTERAIQRYENGLLPLSVLASSGLKAA